MDRLSEDDKLREIIGKKIRSLRKEKKISQVEFGNLLGYTSTGTISQIETGVRGLQLSSIMRVAKILDVHPAVLISPVDTTDYNDLNILSKVINLIEIKHKRPEVAKPLLGAISALLEQVPVTYWASLKPIMEKD